MVVYAAKDRKTSPEDSTRQVSAHLLWVKVSKITLLRILTQDFSTEGLV